MNKEKILNFISSIADIPSNTAEEKRQRRFLIYIGLFMTTGGLCWGSIALYSGLPYQAMIPYGYGIITAFNFTYLYYSKNFQFSQAIQLFISLLLPFLFQLSLGGFVSSGAQVFWAITAILGAFTFKENKSIIIWFFLYIALVILSGLFDSDIRDMNFIEVPYEISILFFVINISAVSLIIFSLFYYFVGSERQHRISLEKNLATLKNTQEQLIEAEKMSSLGSLVAGVAHEVNTPLGVSITAASIFKSEIQNLKKSIEDNTLSKAALNNFINNITQTDELLIKNLDRAALLIKNFKKISVDQSRDDIREFELNSYISEISSTLHNELRQHKVELELECSQDTITLNSNPGAIAQIIINLIQNCLVHAFENTIQAKIIISTRLEENQVIINCIDNGKGVHIDVANRIFEPFITTKRNMGGTGLGLNITHNLVTQQLKGSIVLDQECTEGACFVIKFPLNIETDDSHSI